MVGKYKKKPVVIEAMRFYNDADIRVSRVGEAEERSDLALYTLNEKYPTTTGQTFSDRLPPGEGGGLGAESPISKDEDFKKNTTTS